jgi:uncharacterized Zn finger protein (UPF0148 family)
MKCPNCGKIITEGKFFCGFCGEPIVKIEENARTIPIRDETSKTIKKSKIQEPKSVTNQKSDKDRKKFSLHLSLYTLLISIISSIIFGNLPLGFSGGIFYSLIGAIFPIIKIINETRKVSPGSYSTGRIILFWVGYIIIGSLIGILLAFPVLFIEELIPGAGLIVASIANSILVYITGSLIYKEIWKGTA